MKLGESEIGGGREGASKSCQSRWEHCPKVVDA